MKPSDAEWSVRDLAEMAGTTVRTIHYYISEGLLPPAAGTTRNATYFPAHLARLRLIAALRDEGLALANIRQRLAPLTDEQAIEVAGELDAYLTRADEVGFTTLGLIEAALSSRTMIESDGSESAPVTRSLYSMEQASAMPAAHRLVSEEPTGSASDYLKRVLRKPAAPSDQPVPIPRPRPPARKPIDSDRPEAWYYFEIEDGIELRVREDRYRASKGRLRAVIDTLRTTLRRYGMTTNASDRE